MATENTAIAEELTIANFPLQVYSTPVFRGTLLGSSEDGEHIDRTGLMIWPASYLMCDFLSRYQTELKASPLIELGCGVGVCALVAGMSGLHVTATDIDAESLGLAATNFQANLSAENLPHCTIQSLNWLDLSTSQSLHKVPVVYAADVIYPSNSDELIGALFDTAISLMSDPGCFLCSFVARDGVHTLQRLVKSSEARGLTLMIIPWQVITTQQPKMDATLFCFFIGECPPWVATLGLQAVGDVYPQLWEERSESSVEEWHPPIDSEEDEDDDDVM